MNEAQYQDALTHASERADAQLQNIIANYAVEYEQKMLVQALVEFMRSGKTEELTQLLRQVAEDLKDE